MNMKPRQHTTQWTNLSCIKNDGSLNPKLLGNVGSSPCCLSASEDHLFFICPSTWRLWRSISVHWPRLVSADATGFATSIRPFILLLVLWKRWDAKNSKVLCGINVNTNIVLANIIIDLTLWSHRARKQEKIIPVYDKISFLQGSHGHVKKLG